MPMGRTGVEPDIERIGHLLVFVRLVAQQLHRVKTEPGINALLLDTFGRLLHQLNRTRMQLTGRLVQDRKSTRLNSSHVRISYAVFCLKKKKKKTRTPRLQCPYHSTLNT